MQKHSIHIFTTALLSLGILSGCVADEFGPCPTPDPEPAQAYLQLAVSAAGDRGSRANPTGGENGDGLEHGQGKENTLHDLTLFLYADAGQGLDGAYTVRWSKYIDSSTIIDANPDHPYDHIYNVRIPLDESDFKAFAMSAQSTLRFLAVANAGDLTAAYAASNIREIAQKVADYPQAWTPSADGLPKNSDWFVMSTAFNGAKRGDAYRNDGRVFASKPDPADDYATIYSATVNLERVAARIDLQLTTANITADNRIVYTVDASTAYPDGRAHNSLTLLNAIPVNLMQERSYLVKQLSADTDPTADATMFLSAADESLDTRGIPANYILSPAFFSKPDPSKLAEWYGTSRASWLRDNAASLPTISPLTADLVASAYQFEGAGATDRTLILTYSNENTHPASLQMTSTADGNDIAPSDYLTGMLFRAQYHPAILYTDGACTVTAPYTDGQDFWLFRTVGDEVKESANLYFASRAALNAYVASLPAGGSGSGKGYETAYYPGGICYYNVWVRHADIEATPAENFAMKWGIVRNNIYRINLVFEGVGQPTPEIREPYAVRPRIYVVKWNFRPQPEILM